MVASRNSKPAVVAGLLMLIAGAFNILWMAAVITKIIDIKELLRTTRVISPFPYTILDLGFGGNTVLASIIVILFIVGMLISLIGGACALRNRAWGLALAGSIGACICVPFLGIAAFVITAISKRSFARPEEKRNK